MPNNKSPLNSEKPYSEFLLFFFVVLFIIALAVFVHIRDHNGIRNVCKRTPDVCVPIEYPGKVTK
jgi:hypothetical protein